MITEIKLPQFGMGMSEATIVRWNKNVGDRVSEGEPLVEVESAKAVNEVLAPATGVLEKIITPAQQMAQVYDTLGLIGDGAVAADSPGDGFEPAATPRARRIARDMGVDLRSVTGTGVGGRVTDADVRRHAELERSSLQQVAETDVELPITGTRAAIAKHVFQSLQQTAQLTLSRKVDVTAIVAMREALRRDHGAGYNDVIVKAAALALREHRSLNATSTNDRVIRHPNIDIGVAVAVREGLVVPVVRRVDQQPLKQLAGEIRRLTALGREGKLPGPEQRGGSFSVTNLGPYEIDAFTPIINLPQVAILGVGGISEYYVKQSGAATWRQKMTVSLTIDHRVIDGAPAAEFLRSFAQICADPAALFD
jgi:pyruvate dehydrogenase E2 component (dihydrolipoamide acetyltransferase)